MRRMAEGAKDAQPAWVPWLLGRPGIALAFLWGLAEGTLFLVVPDVLLSLAAMLGPRRALQDGGKEKRGKARRLCPALKFLGSG